MRSPFALRTQQVGGREILPSSFIMKHDPRVPSIGASSRSVRAAGDPGPRLLPISSIRGPVVMRSASSENAYTAFAMIALSIAQHP
jgi:hypothetical protein